MGLRPQQSVGAGRPTGRLAETLRLSNRASLCNVSHSPPFTSPPTIIHHHPPSSPPSCDNRSSPWPLGPATWSWSSVPCSCIVGPDPGVYGTPPGPMNRTIPVSYDRLPIMAASLEYISRRFPSGLSLLFLLSSPRPLASILCSHLLYIHSTLFLQRLSFAPTLTVVFNHSLTNSSNFASRTPNSFSRAQPFFTNE